VIYPPLYRFSGGGSAAGSGPSGRVTALSATSFSATVTSLSGLAGATLSLETRPLGGNGLWASRAADAAPAVGHVLTAAALAEGAPLEWRLIERTGVGDYGDGTHGITVPAESIWSTLTATVAAALQGQGLAASAIYVGRQPESNYADVVAIIRTQEEKVDRRANNVERVVYPIEVEIRVTITDDDGSRQKAEIEKWQERVRAALHEKHAEDFPGIAGLEDVLVEIASKDGNRRSSVGDQYEDQTRAFGIARFTIWRSR